MPVTARLSSRFYEKMGDEATAELVNWLNDVDAEFRAQLRDSNDRNWDRFRADLNTVKVELRAEMASLGAELRAEMASLGAELRSEFQTGIGALRTEMHSELRIQLRWMFGFWATTLLAIAGLKLL
ncbi:MAG: hypothetical protein ABIV11_00290 [Gemmatimonadaceae bacterium]